MNISAKNHCLRALVFKRSRVLMFRMFVFLPASDGYQFRPNFTEILEANLLLICDILLKDFLFCVILRNSHMA